jgi:hypothetical protein
MTPFARASCLFMIALSFPALGVGQEAPPQPTPQPSPTERQVTPSPQPQSTPTPSPETTPTVSGNRQQPADPAPSDSQLTPGKESQETERELQKKEQSNRILGLAPQFGVTRQNAAPLTPGQKFHLFAKASFDPFQYAVAGLQAGLGQATNEFPGYGQGAAGYGKRYGASLADQVSSNFFANYAYPVLLKEDPRYFRLGEGSIKRRIVYSLEQEFVTRTDSGKRRFNFSNALGAFTAGGLSNLYYPSTDRGLGLTMSRSAISLAYGSAGGLIDEFWADIDRKLFHKKPKEQPNTALPSQPH